MKNERKRKMKGEWSLGKEGDEDQFRKGKEGEEKI